MSAAGHKLVIPGCMFSCATLAGAPTPLSGTTALSWPGGGSGEATYALPLVPGQRLDRVEFKYNRGGAGNVQFIVFKVQHGATSTTILDDSGAIAAGTGITAYSTADLRYVVEDGYAVCLHVSGDNAANIFYSAKVTAPE